MATESSSRDEVFDRRFLASLAVTLVILGCGYIFAVTFFDIPESNRRVVDTVIGFIMGTMLASPIGFYFGAAKMRAPPPLGAVSPVVPVATVLPQTVDIAIEPEPTNAKS